MNQSLTRHLVDERDGRSQRVFHACGIPTIDSGANIAERAAKPRTELTVVLAAADVLTVCL